LNLYSGGSLRQQSIGRHVAPLRHMILVLILPVFTLTPYGCMLSREAGNTNFIIFGLTQLGLEPMIYCTWRTFCKTFH